MSDLEMERPENTLLDEQADVETSENVEEDTVASAEVEEVFPESEESAEEEPAAAIETDEPQADAGEPDDDRLWYVVHCYSGYENKVRYNLEQRIESMNMKDKIFDVVVPTEEEIEVKEGKRRTIERRVFPGYILVQNDHE